MAEPTKEEKEKLEKEAKEKAAKEAADKAKKEKEEKDLAEKITKAKAEGKAIAIEDSWMYHKTHEPKLFKRGELIPEDWNSQNIFGWYRDVTNNFHWRKK